MTDRPSQPAQDLIGEMGEPLGLIGAIARKGLGE
jgi:hypothetical protein